MLYFFLKRKPDHPLHGFKQYDNKLSLQDFVSKMGHDKINNGQVSYISGIRDKGDIMLEKALENIEVSK